MSGVTIRAELSGSSICTVSSMTAVANAPVLAMCRRLLDAGHDPATRMEVYRGETLALIVRSIGEAAALELGDRGFKRPQEGGGEARTATLSSTA
jgi:hypothetical protein